MKTFLLAAVSVLSLGAAAQASETTESRNLANFKKIELRGSVDLRVREGSGYAVKVTARPDVIKDIATEVSGDTLEISFKHEGGWGFHVETGKTEVEVTLPELDSLDMRGSGDAREVALSGNHDFSLSISGSGDADVRGSGKKVQVRVAGSGDVKFEGGTANAIDIEVSGSGNVDAKALSAHDANVEVHGSGDVKTTLTGGSAQFSVYGSGDIDWYGTAANVKQNTHGSGDITQK
jgi:hypothetical protein